jgi:hypothetical protein
MDLTLHTEIISTGSCDRCDPDAGEHPLYTARVILRSHGDDREYTEGVLALGPERHSERSAKDAATTAFVRKLTGALEDKPKGITFKA